MMQIRRGVFETNSSSSHSLAYSKKDRGLDYNLPVDADGVLTIPFGEFGFGPQILNTPMEKLSYYITDNYGNYYFYDYLLDKASKDIEDEIYEDEKIKHMITVIKSVCPKVKEVKFQPIGSTRKTLGYVDHQSNGLSGAESDIERLIFDNSVIIVIDNDNDSKYKDYFESWDGHKAKKSVEKLFIRRKK
jgi:hypothetical protein